jgi:hypothetical protein
MAADAIDADEHERADGVERGGAGLGGGEGGLGSVTLGSGCCGGLIEAGGPRRPGGAGGVHQDRFGVVVEGGEESGEVGVHRIGGGNPFCVKLGDELGVRPVHGSCNHVDAGHEMSYSKEFVSKPPRLSAATGKHALWVRSVNPIAI